MALVDRLRLRRRKQKPAEELGEDGPLTAMVIVAHPDDAEFMCGGTVAKWCAQGWTVYYVLATSGDKGTHDSSFSGQQLAATREQEQRDACKALGVKDVIFLGMPDGFLQADAEFRGEVVKKESVFHCLRTAVVRDSIEQPLCFVAFAASKEDCGEAHDGVSVYGRGGEGSAEFSFGGRLIPVGDVRLGGPCSALCGAGDELCKKGAHL